jgi:hypothetical protein
MNQSREESFRQYWPTKTGVVAYDLSEVEDEPNFATVPANSASWAAKLTSLSDPTQTGQVNYPHVIHLAAGSGKTHILIEYIIKQARTAPTTPVASGGTLTLTTAAQSASMATQEPNTADDESVGELIWRVATTLPVSYREKLAVRLGGLQNALLEEQSNGRGITAGSLHHFVEFLRTNPTLRCPAVSATPEGNVYASWKSAPDRMFSIHFLPDGKVRFVIFKPNDKHPGDIIRLSGIATVDIILSTAAPHGIFAWVSE